MSGNDAPAFGKGADGDAPDGSGAPGESSRPSPRARRPAAARSPSQGAGRSPPWKRASGFEDQSSPSRSPATNTPPNAPAAPATDSLTAAPGSAAPGTSGASPLPPSFPPPSPPPPPPPWSRCWRRAHAGPQLVGDARDLALGFEQGERAEDGRIDPRRLAARPGLVAAPRGLEVLLRQPEPRVDRTLGDLEGLGNLADRHLVDVVQDEHDAPLGLDRLEQVEHERARSRRASSRSSGGTSLAESPSAASAASATAGLRRAFSWCCAAMLALMPASHPFSRRRGSYSGSRRCTTTKTSCIASGQSCLGDAHAPERAEDVVRALVVDLGERGPRRRRIGGMAELGLHTPCSGRGARLHLGIGRGARKVGRRSRPGRMARRAHGWQQ